MLYILEEDDIFWQQNLIFEPYNAQELLEMFEDARMLQNASK